MTERVTEQSSVGCVQSKRFRALKAQNSRMVCIEYRIESGKLAD